MASPPPAGRRRVQLTQRDALLLEFLAEHRFARPSHAARLLEVVARTATERLSRLEQAGYLTRDRPYRGQAEHYQITRQGLAAIGSRLRPPRADLSAYAHDMGLVWVWLAARSGAFGPLGELISERQLRSHDARARAGESPAAPVERLGVRIPGEGNRGGERLHYPDLLLRTAGGRRVAVELELSDKGRKRLDKVIRAYAGDRRIDAVLYLVDDERIFRNVQASARKFGVEDLVHVQRVRFTEPAGFPGRARAAERGGGRTAEASDRARSASRSPTEVSL
jgi:DNA-binding MarR family transcriptional regulator